MQRGSGRPAAAEIGRVGLAQTHALQPAHLIGVADVDGLTSRPSRSAISGSREGRSSGRACPRIAALQTKDRRTQTVSCEVITEAIGQTGSARARTDVQLGQRPDLFAQLRKCQDEHSAAVDLVGLRVRVLINAVISASRRGTTPAARGAGRRCGAGC